MKKVFTILITFLLALSLIGVPSAADDPALNQNNPSNYEEVADGAGSDVDVHYSVNQAVVVRIPSDVKFSKGVHHVHDNLTVEKSQIEHDKYLNVYVKSEFNWKMKLAYTVNGAVRYDDDSIILYHMKYDSSGDGLINGDDGVTIDTNIDDKPVCILSMKSGFTKHRLAIGFAIDSDEFNKAGTYDDKLRFTFSIENSPVVDSYIIDDNSDVVNP